MQKNILLILALIVSPIYISGQTKSGKVVYKVKEKMNINQTIDTLDTGPEVKKSLKNEYAKIKNAVPYLSYTMIFDKNEAVFKAPVFMKNDNGIALKNAAYAIGANGLFYTNIKQNTQLHQEYYLDKYWLIKEKIDTLKWHLTDETIQIQGYVCKKATVKVDINRKIKKKVTAWFTPELPFQYGPMGYIGLPGLILKLKKGPYIFYADKINLSQKKKNKIPRPTRGKLVSKKEYYKKTKKLADRMKGKQLRDKE